MKTKKIIIPLLILILLFLLAALILGWPHFIKPGKNIKNQGAKIDKTLIGDAIVLRRATAEGNLMPNAYISIPFTRDSNDYQYINVAVDFNKDGQIAPYQAEKQSQEEWIARNMPVRVISNEGINLSFALPDLKVESRSDFPLEVFLTKSELKAWPKQIPLPAAVKKITIAAIEHDEVRPRFSPDPEGIRAGGFASIFLPPIFARDADKSIPNQPPKNTAYPKAAKGQGEPDMLSGAPAAGAGAAAVPAAKAGGGRITPDTKRYDVFHGGVPDIDQGRNECVPTSAANSLIWLAKKFNFKNSLPANQADIINELKTDFKWRDTGVNVVKNFLSGKDEFVLRHKLPIKTHQVGKRYDTDIVPKIAEELRKGQDVEIEIKYVYFRGPHYTNPVYAGGHMVTVVGAFSFGSKKYLDFHDPLSPGPRKLDIYEIDGTHIINYRYRGRTIAYIRYAIAESFYLSPEVPETPLTPEKPKLTPTPPPAEPSEPKAGGGPKELNPKESELEISGGPLNFYHKIGQSPCPTPIGTFHIEVDKGQSWKIISPIPDWLAISKTSGSGPSDLTASFTCRLQQYITQKLSTNLKISPMPSGIVAGLSISGNIEK